VSPRAPDEPVRLTRVYTRGGDTGETSLGDGSRVSKLDCRIGAFGTVDELNAALGAVLAGEVPEEMRPVLERVQNELFDVGADLSVPWGVTDRLRVEQALVDRLEEACDHFNAELPELRSFVLPGGTKAAARLHVARTICRRAEREVLLGAQEVELNPLVLVYLNRLSDLLFILARAANAAAGRRHGGNTICARGERGALPENREQGNTPRVRESHSCLSNFLFVGARGGRAAGGRDEPLWRPGG